MGLFQLLKKGHKVNIAATQTRGYKKKERTRKKLVESAIDLIGQHDVGGFTLLGLAEAAEMSNGTVYNYFSTREEVLDAVAEEVTSRFSEFIAVLAQAGNSGAERVSMGLRLYIQRAQQDPRWAKALLKLVDSHLQLNSAVIAFIAHDVRLGVQSGEFDVPHEASAVNMIVGAGLIAIRTVVEGVATMYVGHDMALMVLRALGIKKKEAERIASLALPTLGSAEEEAQPRKRGRPRKIVQVL